MSNLKKINGIFGKSVENVEKIHKSISNIPFEALETIIPIRDKVKKIKNVHDTIVDGAYNTIRKVGNDIE